MKKQLILSFLLILILTSLISASLCKGNDGYYHDCDDSKYFKDDYPHYKEDYSYKKYYPEKDYQSYKEYYPTKDYYSYNKPLENYYDKDYYKPKYKKDNTKQYYYDFEEYTRTIEYDYEDKYGFENIKIDIYKKTEIESDYEIPIYLNKQYNNKPKKEKIILNQIPWHYSQYKEYY